MNWIIKQIVKWQLKKYVRGNHRNFSDWCANSFFDGKSFYEDLEPEENKNAVHELKIIQQYIREKKKETNHCATICCTFEQARKYDIDLGCTASCVLYFLDKYFDKCDVK